MNKKIKAAIVSIILSVTTSSSAFANQQNAIEINEAPPIYGVAQYIAEEALIEKVTQAVEEVTEALNEEPEPTHIYSEAFNEMSAEEYDLMARILALEAQTEPFEGQVAVVEVIMNRVIGDRYPDTIYDVLSQKGEFATWKYLDHPYNTPNQEQYDAINYVIENGPTILPIDYLYFSTGKASFAKDFIKIEHHYFGRAK